MKKVDLVIIGGGAAGLASALSAYSNGVKDILIIERGDHLGGILNQCIHNGFGLEYFKEELSGPEYADRFIKKIEENGIKYLLNTQVLGIGKDKSVTYINSEDGFNKINARAIIFSAGCNERTAGQISLPGNRPKGVYTAGLAQKYMNIDGYLVGKRVYILGSGDIGLIMARRMSLEGAKVIGVSELMPYSNGLNRNIVQCLNDFDIPLRLSNTVTKVIGRNNLEAIEISDVDANLKPIKGTEKIIECDTLLLSIGLYPFNALLKQAGCEVNPRTKGSKVNQNLWTLIQGIYSCVNVLHVHYLVDFVTLEGEKAGKCAAYDLIHHHKHVEKRIVVEAKENLNYVLPNYIDVTKDLNEVSYSFRVKKPISKGRITFKDGDKVIKTITKMNLIPSEMVKVSLNNVDFNEISTIDVSVEEF